MDNKNEIDMTRGGMLPKLLAFSLPLMLTNALQLLFNAADLIVVGRFSGDNSLAAVGSNSALITLVICVLSGIATGASVLVSRYYGAKDGVRLRETIQTTVIVAAVGGALVGAAGIALADPLLRLMGTPEAVLPLAALYLRIYFGGMPVIILYNFVSAILRAVGDTKRPLYFLTIAGVLNVGMNLLFVIVFHLDVAGVAIATVLSQCVSCGLTVRCLVKADAMYRLDLHHLRLSPARLGELLHIGLPAGVQGSFFSISNIMIQSAVNAFGAVVMAGNSAGASIESFLYCAQDSVTQAAVTAVSQNMGAREFERTRRAVRACTLLVIVFSAVLSAAAILLRYQLVGIYTDDPAAIETGATRLVILGAVYGLNGLMNMMTGSVRGLGYDVLPTVVTLLGICVFRLVWIYTVFARVPTLTVLYISYPVTWAITAAAHYACYFAVRKRAYARAGGEALPDAAAHSRAAA